MIPIRAVRRLPTDTSVIEAFAGDPGAWLPAPARVFGPSTWSVELQGGPLHRTVAMSLGLVWRRGDTAWRALRWEPVEDGSEVLPLESLLPVFVGEIGLVASDERPDELRLQGSYAPPGGLAGAVADHVGLHRVAQRTADRLLDHVGARLRRAAATASTAPT